MPSFSVRSLCCARTSSPMRTCGNLDMPFGAGVLCGEDESPEPIWLMTTMKYLSGSSARPDPMKTCSMILLVPVYHVVTRIALSLASFSVPNVAYASLQRGIVPPSSSVKSPMSAT